MFVKVFSRIVEKQTEAALVNLHTLLVAEQKGKVITYTFANKEYHKMYFPTEAEALRSLETFEKKESSSICKKRWDMPAPDLESMAMIRYYEESKNTELLQ